jgi:hypothetical protein
MAFVSHNTHTSTRSKLCYKLYLTQRPLLYRFTPDHKPNLGLAQLDTLWMVHANRLTMTDPAHVLLRCDESHQYSHLQAPTMATNWLRRHTRVSVLLDKWFQGSAVTEGTCSLPQACQRLLPEGLCICQTRQGRRPSCRSKSSTPGCSGMEAYREASVLHYQCNLHLHIEIVTSSSSQT